jgi:chromosome partitioning protein
MNHPRTLAISLQKGGVGKSTTTVNLAYHLAQRGRRVLVIDLDPQANATVQLGVNPTEVKYSSYEVLLYPERGIGPAVQTTEYGIDLIPAVIHLAAAETNITFAREQCLRTALTATADLPYDYILIDTPPSLGLFTMNALVAADSVLVPLQLHAHAWQAMISLEATVDLARRLNPGLHISGIVCTMADKRTTLSQLIEGQARKHYGDKVLTTVIPLSIKLAEAPALRAPGASYAPDSKGAQAYNTLATELEDRYGK